MLPSRLKPPCFFDPASLGANEFQRREYAVPSVFHFIGGEAPQLFRELTPTTRRNGWMHAISSVVQSVGSCSVGKVEG